jgi:hypothetical protein
MKIQIYDLPIHFQCHPDKRESEKRGADVVRW